MNFKYFLIFILFIQSTLFSKTIFFEDVELERSKIVNLPIQIDEEISNSYPFDLQIEFIFNAYMFEINSVEDVTPQNITDFEIELNLDDLSRSKLIINSTINEFNNILFILNLTGLASKDSISVMELTNIEINKEVQDDINFNSGTFRISNLVFNLESSLSEIYPNPIISNAFIDLNIRQESVIQYKIFDLNGKNLDYQIENDKFLISIFDSNNEKVEFENETKLDVGEYKLEIFPNRFFTSMGTYRLLIQINERTYYKNFIYGG